MNQDMKFSRIKELGKVWTPEAEWEIPTNRGEAVFAFPASGPDNYNEVVKQVLANGQRLPTGEQTAFMLDEAYNSAGEEVRKSPRTEFVRKNMIYNGVAWVPVVNIWTPRNIKNPGMYAVFDENGEGLAKERSFAELEDRLSSRGVIESGVRFSEDRKVAFAPLNTIKEGDHEKGTLSQDGAFIANYGVKGAEKLDRIAESFTLKPYSWVINNASGKLIQSLSALGRIWGLVVDRLSADFYSNGNNRDGYVLSVSAPSDKKY